MHSDIEGQEKTSAVYPTLGPVSPNNHISFSNERSVSRKSSRSPRSNKTAIVDPSPVVTKQPDFLAWPAPPNMNVLSSIKAPPVKASVVQHKSPAPHSPPSERIEKTPSNSNVSSSNNVSSNNNLNTFTLKSEANYLCNESSQLYSMLKVAASTGIGKVQRRESELQRKIDNLEETLVEYERQKFSVIGSFSEYQGRVADRERKLEAEYSGKIIALSEEVLSAKKDFEFRMKNFQALQEKFDREKECALEKLRKEHQKEIQLLEQRFSSSQLLNLEQKYIIEIQRLEEERKSLKREKDCLGETFEMKLRRAQTLYETELTAAKMLYNRELEALRDHEEALKEELSARQEEYQDRFKEVEHQSKQGRDKLSSCVALIEELKAECKIKDIELNKIHRELDTSKERETNFLKNVKERNEIGLIARGHLEELDKQLAVNSKKVNDLKNDKNELETKIKIQETELKNLRARSDFLETERKNLQSQSQSQFDMQNSQLQALEAVLESVTMEKETCKIQFEKNLCKEKEDSQEREYLMKKEFSSKLNKLEEQYSVLRDQMEGVDDESLEKEQKMVSDLDSMMLENRKLRQTIIDLEDQLESDDCEQCKKHRTHDKTIEKMLQMSEQFKIDSEKDKTAYEILSKRLQALIRRAEQSTASKCVKESETQIEVIHQEIQADVDVISVNKLNEANDRIETLISELNDLSDTNKSLERELSKKVSELKTFKDKTNDYIKFREDHLSASSEKKLNLLKVETEKAIKELKNREYLIVDEMDAMKKAKSDTCIDISSLCEDGYKRTFNSKENLSLKAALSEKDKEIERLNKLMYGRSEDYGQDYESNKSEVSSPTSPHNMSIPSVIKTCPKHQTKILNGSDGSMSPPLEPSKKERKQHLVMDKPSSDIRSKSPAHSAKHTANKAITNQSKSEHSEERKKSTTIIRGGSIRVKKETTTTVTNNIPEKSNEKRPAWKF